MSNPVIIMWFRHDLRLKDNPALFHAVDIAQNGTVDGVKAHILPIFIQDESAPQQAQLGGASKWWLHQSLESLSHSTDNALQLFSGEPLAILQALIAEHNVTHVLWNRCYEPWQITRDSNIKSQLKQQNIEVLSCNGHLLWEPMQVLKKDNTPYKVFTPYYRKGCLTRTEPRYPQYLDLMNIDWSRDVSVDHCEIAQLGLLPDIHWHDTIEKMWQPGEQGAAERLATFIAGASGQYRDDRNIPAVTGTSLLSPYLHFGEISINTVWYALKDAYANDPDNAHCDTYLSELGWREFSHYLLFHFPHIPTENFNTKFNTFVWRNDPQDLQAWQRGQTGIPIVDAGMRELYQTGYMHNRVRMIVGSFLVKNLLVDWRIGERWFWDCLLDAGMAANSASWQWVASSGADASPYFRIFNPILQGEKFDKQGDYVKRYCPELRKLPPKFIHQPWEAPNNILNACDVVLGHNYPKPLVDLKVSRQRALDTFAKSKEDALNANS